LDDIGASHEKLLVNAANASLVSPGCPPASIGEFPDHSRAMAAKSGVSAETTGATSAADPDRLR
jgi:hypothetical protein